MMWGSSVSLGLVVLSLLAPLGESARMVAKTETMYASLTATQQQLRKESLKAEASLVCGTTEIKAAINADKDVYGLPDINWGDVKKTAADGLEKTNKAIALLTAEIAELDAKYKALLESEKYGELPRNEIDDMLKASCTAEGFNIGEGCAHASATSCGWNSDLLDVPFDEPVELFRASAEKKLNGYTTLSANAFNAVCKETLPGDDCGELCYEFAEIVKELSSNEASAKDLASTETSDDVAKQLKDKGAELADAQAEKSACTTANAQLKEFADQLDKLGSTVSRSKRAATRFKRVLRTEEMKLEAQKRLLKKLIAELLEAKEMFAKATVEVAARQAAVDTMIAELKRLEQALEEQRAKIARLVQKLADIEDATDAGRLFKSELSRVLANAVAYNTEAVTTPLFGLGLSPEQNIAKNFGDAEAAAAPAMKDTVTAVGDYCGSQEVLTALNGVQVDASQQLNYICTGQDWNNMIVEAQDTVKQDAKTVVDILVEEQAVANEDAGVPSKADLRLRQASGEPEGLRHALALFGGNNGGTFVKGYVYPGWSVTLVNGNAADVGKMLKLYQKLGEAFDAVTADWEEAKEGERQLIVEVAKAVEQVEVLTKLLQKAIAAQQIAKAEMDAAQKLVDEAEQTKKDMERRVASAETRKAKGDEAFNDAKDALMAEHKERSEALLELFQELQQQQ